MKDQRSKEQKTKNALYNIDMLYKERNEAIKFFDKYSSMVSEAKKIKKSKMKSFILDQSKEITKIIYNNIINSIKL